MTDVELRRMRWWDIDPVLAIEHELFEADAWTAGLFWSELAQHDSRHYVVLGADDIVGYGGLAVVDNDAYVQTIAVRKRLWGEGLGTVLLADLLTKAEERGAESVGLEVRADNERAHRLYERFGFRVIGVRRGYYQPSGADAHVMVRRSI